MIRALISFSFLTLVVSSCSSLSISKNAVDQSWLNEQKSIYPDNEYYSGYGIGDSLENAKLIANEKLAQAIVDGLYKSDESKTKNNQHTNFDEKLIYWTTKLNLEQTIIEIVNTAQISNTTTKTTKSAQHVITVVERAKLAQAVKERTVILDKTSHDLFRSASTNDALVQIAAAHQMVKSLVESHFLAKLQKQADPTSIVIEPKHDVFMFAASYEILLSSIVIIADSKDPRITQMFQDSLKEVGFNRNPLNNRIPYILETNLRKDISKDGELYILKGKVSIDMKKGNKNGAVKGSANWPLSITSKTKSKLSDEAVNKIAELCQSNLKETIVQIALNSFDSGNK